MTNKSGNLNVDSKSNCKKSMEEHVKDDEVIDRKEHDRREKLLNEWVQGWDDSEQQ